MKNDIKKLTQEVERKAGKKISLSSDFERLAHIVCKGGEMLRPQSLKKVWGYLSGTERPSQETLDRLALFIGFQDWKSFQKELHGDADA